jgi:hypothetical protein
MFDKNSSVLLQSACLLLARRVKLSKYPGWIRVKLTSSSFVPVLDKSEIFICEGSTVVDKAGKPPDVALCQRTSYEKFRIPNCDGSTDSCMSNLFFLAMLNKPEMFVSDILAIFEKARRLTLKLNKNSFL